MKKKDIILILLLFIYNSCTCNNNENIPIDSIKNDSIKNEKFNLIYSGSYENWISTKNDLYFPLILLNKKNNNQDVKYYEKRFLIRRNYWLILVEIDQFGYVLNQYPLIPLRYMNETKVKKDRTMLTSIFPDPSLFNTEINVSHTKLKDDTYKVIITVSNQKNTCNHIIDISYLTGSYFFTTDCDCTRIWEK